MKNRPRARIRPRAVRRVRGLRFDKVATRVVDRLKSTLAGAVPPGTIVLVAITAPIRLAAKTTEAIDAKVRTLLAQKSQTRDRQLTVHGNRVRIRVVRNAPRRASWLAGFVHNPDVDARTLLDAASQARPQSRTT